MTALTVLTACSLMGQAQTGLISPVSPYVLVFPGKSSSTSFTAKIVELSRSGRKPDWKISDNWSVFGKSSDGQFIYIDADSDILAEYRLKTELLALRTAETQIVGHPISALSESSQFRLRRLLGLRHPQFEVRQTSRFVVGIRTTINMRFPGLNRKITSETRVASKDFSKKFSTVGNDGQSGFGPERAFFEEVREAIGPNLLEKTRTKEEGAKHRSEWESVPIVDLFVQNQIYRKPEQLLQLSRSLIDLRSFVDRIETELDEKIISQLLAIRPNPRFMLARSARSVAELSGLGSYDYKDTKEMVQNNWKLFGYSSLSDATEHFGEAPLETGTQAAVYLWLEGSKEPVILDLGARF